MTFLLPPDVLARRTVKYAEYLKRTPGVKFGIKSIDSKMIPAKPGEAIAFMGRPGHGKSLMLGAIAKNHAIVIADAGMGTVNADTPGEAVLYVTYEQLAETQDFSTLMGIPSQGEDMNITDIHWGRSSLEELNRRAAKRPKLPLWIAGTSHADLGKPRPRMYIEALFNDIVDTYHKRNIKFSLVCVDYLQLIPVQRGRTRSEEVGEATKMSKWLAQELGCPVILGVQAKAEVDKRDDKIPGMGDAYYTSELDHDMDKIFGLMRPSRYQAIGSTYEMKSGNDTTEFLVTHNLTLMRMSKQRGDVGTHNFAFSFNPANMEMAEVSFQGGQYV